MLPWSFLWPSCLVKNNTQQIQPQNTPWKTETPLQTIHLSGQISIIPKPALRACWGKSLTKPPQLGVFPGCYNLPKKYPCLSSIFQKRCLCHVSVLDLSQFLTGRALQPYEVRILKSWLCIVGWLFSPPIWKNTTPKTTESTQDWRFVSSDFQVKYSR